MNDTIPFVVEENDASDNHGSPFFRLKTVADAHNCNDVSKFESACCGRRVDTFVFRSTDRSERDSRLGHLHGSSVTL